MANPTCKDGFIRIANEYFDQLIKVGLPKNARQILDFVIRQTWGWNRRDARIRLKDFVTATGVKTGNVSRELKRLIGANYIIQTDNLNGLSYRIQKDYTKWKRLSKRITAIQRNNNQLSKRIANRIQMDNQNPGKTAIHENKREAKDNLKHNLNDNQDDSLKTEEASLLQEAHEQAKALEGTGFNPHQFIEKMSKTSHHPEDILTCINRLKDRKGKIKSLWGYGEEILAGLAGERRYTQWEKTKERERQEVEALIGRIKKEHPSENFNVEEAVLELTNEDHKRNRERLSALIKRLG